MLGWGTRHFDGGFLILQIMNNEIEGFVFYKSFYEAISQIEEIDKRCIAYTAIFEYCFFGVEPNLTGTPNIIWTLMKPQIDSSIKNYLNGKKGGAPQGNQNARKQPKTTENNPLCIVDETTKTSNKNSNKNNNKNNNSDKNNNSVNTHHPLFSKTYIELIEKYGATDVEAERALDNWNNLTEKDKLNCIGGIQKYFLYLESKPGYSKNDLSYYLKDKMWEWGCIIKMKSKPKTEEEIMKQMDIDFQKYLEEQKNKKQKLKN
jgi:hypothetical protein